MRDETRLLRELQTPLYENYTIGIMGILGCVWCNEDYNKRIRAKTQAKSIKRACLRAVARARTAKRVGEGTATVWRTRGVEWSRARARYKLHLNRSREERAVFAI